MKYFLGLSLFMFLSSGPSWSYPESGDFVQYEASYEGAQVLMEKKVLSHDLENDTFIVRTLVTYKERIIQDQTVILPRSFLYTPEKIQHVIDTCLSREGAISEVRVQGKELEVCEFYNDDYQLTSMIGSVPFGQVRFQVYLQGEEFLDFNLKKFSAGK
jgi:hypothetical protein